MLECGEKNIALSESLNLPPETWRTVSLRLPAGKLELREAPGSILIALPGILGSVLGSEHADATLPLGRSRPAASQHPPVESLGDAALRNRRSSQSSQQQSNEPPVVNSTQSGRPLHRLSELFAENDVPAEHQNLPHLPLDDGPAHPSITGSVASLGASSLGFGLGQSVALTALPMTTGNGEMQGASLSFAMMQVGSVDSSTLAGPSQPASTTPESSASQPSQASPQSTPQPLLSQPLAAAVTASIPLDANLTGWSVDQSGGTAANQGRATGVAGAPCCRKGIPFSSRCLTRFK